MNIIQKIKASAQSHVYQLKATILIADGNTAFKKGEIGKAIDLYKTASENFSRAAVLSPLTEVNLLKQQKTINKLAACVLEVRSLKVKAEAALLHLIILPLRIITTM